MEKSDFKREESGGKSIEEVLKIARSEYTVGAVQDFSFGASGYAGRWIDWGKKIVENKGSIMIPSCSLPLKSYAATLKSRFKLNTMHKVFIFSFMCAICFCVESSVVVPAY